MTDKARLSRVIHLLSCKCIIRHKKSTIYKYYSLGAVPLGSVHPCRVATKFHLRNSRIIQGYFKDLFVIFKGAFIIYVTWGRVKLRGDSKQVFFSDHNMKTFLKASPHMQCGPHPSSLLYYFIILMSQTNTQPGGAM